MGEPFLSRFETRRLQGMYEVWLQTVKSDVLATKLFEMNLLSRFEYEKYQTLQTGHDKAGYLFHNVLMKSTYDDMCRVRKFLIQTGSQGHIHLAKLMPDRGERIDFEDIPIDYSASPYKTGNSPKYVQKEQSYQCSEGGDNDVEMHDDDILDLGDEIGVKDDTPSSMVDEAEYEEPVAKKAGTKVRPGQRNIGKVQPQRQKVNPVAKAAALPDYKNYMSDFPIYEPKAKNNKKTGKGLCVIIRNFTEDLPGYREDAKIIEEVFTDLDYTVWSEDYHLVDLSKQQFETKLGEIQDFMKNKFNSLFDRFFMFILSHGDEHGIKTCKRISTFKPGDRREFDEEIDPDTNQPVRIPVEAITKMFTHDKVPALKGYPKCFMIQACQGEAVAKPAATSDPKEYDEQRLSKTNEPKWKPPKVDIAVGADILVCLPSEKGTYSWVPSTGSWFIQETMALLRKYHEYEHFVDIMVQTNHVLSQKMGKGQVTNNSDIIDVVQMPGLSCSLTKKFYLSIPDGYNNDGSSA